MRQTLTHSLLLALTLSPLAAGAKIHVFPGPGTPIQDAVDAAGPGDTVRLHGGEYFESVTIPATKTGLTLDAAGSVRLDRLAGTTGSLVVVEATDVTIRGFELRNSALDGIECTGDRLRVEKMRLVHCDNYGVRATADDVLIFDCEMVACWGSVRVDGDRVLVKGCELRQSRRGTQIVGDAARIHKNEITMIEDDDGVDIEGDDAVVTKNRIDNVDRVGVNVEGAGARIEKNVIRSFGDEAVRVDGAAPKIAKNVVRGGALHFTVPGVLVTNGDGASVVGNEVESVTGRGFDVTGADVTVADNSVANAGAGGIRVTGAGAVVDENEITRCDGDGVEVDGDNPTITGNEVDQIVDDRSGVRVSNASSGTLSKNVVRRAAEYGFQLLGSTSGLLVEGNTARMCGSQNSEGGFLIAGTGITLRKNEATMSRGDGFRVTGDGNTLDANVATENYNDGFDVEDADGTVLVGNVATKNTGEGFDNGGTNTVIEGNTSKKNRIDFASDGTVASFTNNASGDGSDETTAPEID